MTKPFGVQYNCEYCGNDSTAETDFNRWMRAQPKLNSRYPGYIVRTDMDNIILKYKTAYGKSLQFLMIVEVKTRCARPDIAQLDLLRFIDQLILKRGKNMHGAETHPEVEVWSEMNRIKVDLKYLGYYILRLENTSPANGRIDWNGDQSITEANLIDILALDRHPKPPYKQISEYIRDHHRRKTFPLIEDIEQ